MAALLTTTPAVMNTTPAMMNTTPAFLTRTTPELTTTPKVLTTGLLPNTTQLPFTTTPAIEKCNILEGGEYIFNTTSRRVGTIRTVGCVENYYRVGDAVIRCNPDGHWSSHPICERMCSGWRDKNLLVDNPNRTYGSLVNVACKDGYKLFRPSTSYLCLEPGLWNDTQNRCKAEGGTASLPVAVIVICVIAIFVVLVILGLVLYMLISHARKERAIKKQEEQFRAEIMEQRNFKAVAQDFVGMPVVTIDSLHPTLKGHPDKTEDTNSQNGSAVKDGGGGVTSVQNQDDKMKSMMY